MNKFSYKSGYYMEIYSGNEIVLSGKIEVEKLCDTVLMIICNEHRIVFTGNDIRIPSFDYNGIVISGNIEKIDFS